jgi:hypothetical protein
LTKSSYEVYCCENGASGSSNISDAFTNVLHGVFVGVGVSIEGSEVLDEPDAPAFLSHCKDGAVELAACQLNDAKFLPLGQMFLKYSLGILNCLT